MRMQSKDAIKNVQGFGLGGPVRESGSSLE
jgi:hypothetical protein